jgi:hypothetical protein
MARFGSLLIAALLAAHAADAAELSVTFVGCVEHAMADEYPPPPAPALLPKLPEKLAARLVLYGSADLAVLAPRGWVCATLSGSSGGFLMVVPPEAEPADWYKASFSGPAIQLSKSFSGTSGRFQVAQIFARIFPDQDRFVQSVIAEGLWPAGDFPKGPFANDEITVKRAELVEYRTPAGADGLGLKSRLGRGDAISGAALILSQDEPDLLKLDIRLPEGQADLVPIIRDWVEGHYAETTLVQ